MNKIEMSLDDIIKSTRSQNRNSQRRNRGGDRRRGSDNRVHSSPRKPNGGIIKHHSAGGIQKAKFSRGYVNKTWKNDGYNESKRELLQKFNSAKIIISNLDYGVSDSDIRELFGEFGPIKKAAVHYDHSGRSQGTAFVVYERKTDALKAIEQYNRVPFDGRPMIIQFLTRDVGANYQKPGPKVQSDAREVIFNGNRLGGNTTASGGHNTQKTAPTANKFDIEMGLLCINFTKI